MGIRQKVGELHAQLSLYQRRVERAQELVQQALARCDAPYVALSGGKDSTVVLDLVREQFPDVNAIWSDDRFFLPETGTYMARLERDGVQVQRIRTCAWHAEWFAVEGDYDSIAHYAKLGFDADLVFLGLRQEESRARRVHLRKYGALFFAQSDDCWHCNPLSRWTWRDVWAYIYARDVDYNRAYDVLEEIGVEPERQRIGPLAVERVLGYGQIAILKRGWPEVYQQFVDEFPEASVYV